LSRLFEIGECRQVTTIGEMSSLERDLAAYYDRESEQRATRAVDARRAEMREAFADLLISENRRRVVEIGTGPGRDAQALLTRGLSI